MSALFFQVSGSLTSRTNRDSKKGVLGPQHESRPVVYRAYRGYGCNLVHKDTSQSVWTQVIFFTSQPVGEGKKQHNDSKIL